MKGIASRLALALTVLLTIVALSLAQKPDEKAAEGLLASARKSYAEKRFPEAAGQFRDLLNRFAQSKHANDARYGLALALLEMPEPDVPAIQEALKKLETDAGFPERRFVLYHLGTSERLLGVRALAQAGATPMKQTELQASARKHFEDAEKRYAAAADAFGNFIKTAPVEGKGMPAELPWLFRARADQAEMLLRLDKPKEARAVLAPVLADVRLIATSVKSLANYYEGVACYLENNNLAAGRALSRVAFTDPVIGSHARYLLARVHEKAEEDAEATVHYEGVLADYERAKVMANEALKRPERLTPRERARLESLRRDPAPEHVGRAAFYLGMQYYAAGRFGDAQSRFAEFLKQNARSPLAPEAQLRLGMCQVQNKQYGEAMKTLQPLAKNDPPRPAGAAALYWLGKAQAGDAAPDNAPVNKDKVRIALATLTQSTQATAQAYDKADPDLPRLQADILLDMADAQMQAGLFKDAAQTYGIVLENARAGAEEEALQRRAVALHLAGDFDASDKACEQFQQKFPGSPFLGAIVFRHAENAAFRLAAAEKAGQKPANLRDEALKRYQTLIDRFPDFPYTNYAHYSKALMFARAGDWEKTRKSLEAIPAPDRGGEMAPASFLLADILIRTMPAKVDDALAAGRLEEQLKAATELLDGYVGAAAKDPRMPEALVKLGYCQLRSASLLAQPQLRAEAFNRARATFDRLRNELAKDDAGGWGLLGRGQVGILSGDIASGEKYLRRFEQDPFAQSSAAPAGAIELAALLRARGRAAEAAPVIGRVMQRHEPILTKAGDPHGWLPKLRLQYALALKESGKLPEARGVFEAIIKQSPDRPEAAEATLRLAQILADEARPEIDKLRPQLANLGLKPEDRANVQKAFEAQRAKVLQAAAMLVENAARYQKKEGAADTCARMLYDAVWLHRYLGDLDPNTAAKTLEIYPKLIAAQPDAPLAMDARLELAEFRAFRGENAAALKLLDDLTEKEPPAEIMEKIAVLRGACLVAKGDSKGAREQVDALAKNVKSPLAPWAKLVAGEASFRAGEWDTAIKELVAFRDQDPYRQTRGAAERGLWLLGQAHARKGDWARSREAFDQVASRFDGGVYAAISRYGAGIAYRNEKNWEAAANAFTRAAQGSSGSLASLAETQAGLCRLEQKRYGDAVNILSNVRRHGVGELSAFALVEAARAHVFAKQLDAADKLLAQVEKESPITKAAAVATAGRQALKDKKDIPAQEAPPWLKDLVPISFHPQHALTAPVKEKPAAEGAGIAAFLAVGKFEIPTRSNPAPFLRLNLPDPFEHRRAVRLRPAPAESLPLASAAHP